MFQTSKRMTQLLALSMLAIAFAFVAPYATSTDAQDDDIIGIHAVQGDSAATPFEGEVVRIEGVITADYQGNSQYGGFYIQEQAEDEDGNPATSEGIFVYCDPDDIFGFDTDGNDELNNQVCSDNPNIDVVTVGDIVVVEGVATEFFDMTQIDARNGSVELVSSDNALPAVVEINIQANLIDTGAAPGSYYEAYEGMLVQITDTMTVSEYFQLSRFGQIVLYQGGRPYQYTHLNDEFSEEGFEAFQADLDRRRIILDDDSNVENFPLVRDTSTIFYPAPASFGVGEQGVNFFRGGDTITNLTGVLGYAFRNWRIYPIPSAPAEFTPVNPRPLEAPEVGGTLTVASFNVLNYFTTLNERGADSDVEFERQATKIVTALVAIDADIVGLMEIENNGIAVADLVDRLNAAIGEDAYAYIDTGVIGTDAIAVAIIYKVDTVMPIGETAVLDDESFTNPFAAETPKNRPAIAQTFTEIASGENVTVVVNHLKSKGSECGEGDDDPIQGNCNGTRTAAAEELLSWLATDPMQTGDENILIIGDINAYAGEDPIDAIRAAGYTDLLGGPGTENYTYLFSGQVGYLDHALASEAIVDNVVGTASWYINADEVPVFDYNDDILDDGERRFEQEPGGTELYEPNAFRSSDHDPVIIGLELAQ